MELAAFMGGGLIIMITAERTFSNTIPFKLTVATEMEKGDRFFTIEISAMGKPRRKVFYISDIHDNDPRGITFILPDGSLMIFPRSEMIYKLI